MLGLPSIPMITTLAPAPRSARICSATGSASVRQCARKAGVSYCSRTAQNRRVPPNASSGQGICRIVAPCERSSPTTGADTPAQRAPSSTLAFAFSRQCAR